MLGGSQGEVTVSEILDERVLYNRLHCQLLEQRMFTWTETCIKSLRQLLDCENCLHPVQVYSSHVIIIFTSRLMQKS